MGPGGNILNATTGSNSECITFSSRLTSELNTTRTLIVGE